MSHRQQELDPELDPAVAETLAKLRQLAAAFLRRERPDHTLQPTELVHEAFLRVAPHYREHGRDARHFLALAASAMRRVLVDHARRRGASKRAADRVTVDVDVLPGPQQQLDVLELDRAMERLAGADERRARLAELHLFAGLSAEECGEVLGMARRTAFLHLRSAKAFLARELTR